MKTLESIFSTVKNHLLNQDKRAVSADDSCSYRGVNGTSCAIGCLIQDYAYNPTIEGRTVGRNTFRSIETRSHAWKRDLAVLTALQQSGLPTHNRAMVLYAELQAIHDSEQPSDWEERLNYLSVRTFGSIIP